MSGPRARIPPAPESLNFGGVMRNAPTSHFETDVNGSLADFPPTYQSGTDDFTNPYVYGGLTEETWMNGQPPMYGANDFASDDQFNEYGNLDMGL